ncbi:hypothetical protein Tco_0606847 [Tanacetum coccineum]
MLGYASGLTMISDIAFGLVNKLTSRTSAVNPDEPVESNEVLTNDQPQKTNEPDAQPSNKIQTPPIPFPRRLRKEKKRGSTEEVLGKPEANPHKSAFHQGPSLNAKIC